MAALIFTLVLSVSLLVIFEILEDTSGFRESAFSKN